jgi:methyl-accepting chemotaxis protein
MSHDVSTGGPSTGGGGVIGFLTSLPDGQSIPDEMWNRRHRRVLAFAALHVPLLLAMGLYSGTDPITGARIPETGTTAVAVRVGLLGLLVAAAAAPALPRRVRTGLSATALTLSSLILVFFSGGYIEAHFHFFVVMGVLAIYEDWVPFALGIGYVALSHGYFGMVEPARVYNHAAGQANPWVWGGIHALFVTTLAGALTANWFSIEQSRAEAAARLEEVERKQAELDSLEAKKAEIQEAHAEAERQQSRLSELNDDLERTAEEYQRAMDRAADGDLTVRVDATSDNEAMARIGESFNAMMDRTERTVESLQGFAARVAATSDEAVAGIDEVRDASEEVSESVQEIADGTDRQRERLHTVTDEMTDLSATIEEVASSAESVADTSHETASVAADGEETAAEAIERTEAAQEVIGSTADHVETLAEGMTEIGEVIDLIGEIAEQTNMLALNANIEAARAGAGNGSGSGSGNGAGNGDGFAVVANEVKQLAEETRESADDVEARIEELQTQTDETAERARAAEEQMASGVAAVEAVVEAFDQVAANAEATDDGVRTISDATDDQAASAEEAVSMVEEVSEIGQETASRTETVSAAAEQQTASVSEVTSRVEELAESARELTDELNERFTVAAEGEADGDSRSTGPGAGASPTGDPVVGDGGSRPTR